MCTGTGRSLSLKLLQQLREEGAKLSSAGSGDGTGAGDGGRTFREIVLQEPIRWARPRCMTSQAQQTWQQTHGLHHAGKHLSMCY